MAETTSVERKLEKVVNEERILNYSSLKNGRGANMTKFLG